MPPEIDLASTAQSLARDTASAIRLCDSLRAEMEKAASSGDFEAAVDLRDKIFTLLRRVELNKTKTTVRSSSSHNDALEELASVLFLSKPPKTIDCFDVSNLGCSQNVSAVVRFVDGLPQESEYGRFCLKEISGPDDYKCMRETFKMWFLSSAMSVPDLIVVDGGRGHLSAAVSVLGALGIVPPIVGLSKAKETLHLTCAPHEVNLPPSPALFLLQRIRDEAHRVANSFNAEVYGRTLLPKS